jgi:Ca-activated chloride channel family protein
MKSSHLSTTCFVAAFGLLAGAGSAFAAEAPKKNAVEVAITSPSPLQPTFGRVEVVVEVKADEELAEVALTVDEKRRVRLTEPPWRFVVDVGEENREHQFSVTARTMEGEVGESTMKTPAVQIDDQLDVALQQLYVTVSQGNRRALDLQQGSFQITDDGVPQEVVTFERGDVPITAALLVDSSASMKGERLDGALRGTKAFVDGMKELDEASLMLFSDRLLRATPFTNSSEQLLDALDGVQPGGNTSVNDHLYLALKLLDARQGRRVIVLFSDGADLHSVLDMEDVLWKARRSQALVYWIVLLDGGAANKSFITAWRGKQDNARQLLGLERITDQTGGRVIGIRNIEETESAFREILAELREQYVLGYYPSASRDDGRWHSVKVSVSRSGLDVRTREGYVDQ